MGFSEPALGDAEGRHDTGSPWPFSEFVLRPRAYMAYQTVAHTAALVKKKGTREITAQTTAAAWCRSHRYTMSAIQKRRTANGGRTCSNPARICFVRSLARPMIPSRFSIPVRHRIHWFPSVAIKKMVNVVARLAKRRSRALATLRENFPQSEGFCGNVGMIWAMTTITIAENQLA